MSLVEIIGFVLTLLAISLATRGKILTWPLQIIASLLYVYLFLSVNLFGESVLQLIYAGIATYGWLNWGKTQSQGVSLQVFKLSKKEWLVINAIGISLMLLVAQLQVQFLPTDVPYLDSTVFILVCWRNGCKQIKKLKTGCIGLC
jgi:nicotinamide mononucleotide transporter